MDDRIVKTAYKLTALLQNEYSSLRRNDFVDLTLLLLEYWSLEDDLSSAFANSEISFDIEEKIIELGNKYQNE